MSVGTALNRRPVLLFNCTTNVVGGGVQNAANFIMRAVEDRSVDWRFAISCAVGEACLALALDVPGEVFTISPARSKASRERLRGLAGKWGVDGVYTMAGPAYVQFPVAHVQGISNAYLTHVDAKALFIGRSPAAASFSAAKALYQTYWARRADFWIFQTEESRHGFVRRARIDRRRTAVVGNALGVAYYNDVDCSKPKWSGGDRTIFCPGAAYPHKSLDIVPDVAKELLAYRPDLKVRFILTLPQDSGLWRSIHSRVVKFGLDNVQNIGPYSYDVGPRLYGESDCVFIPSMLETFSTAYVEAMACGCPLVVVDKGFAREICGSGAYYFQPRVIREAVCALDAALSETPEQAEARGERQKFEVERFGRYVSRYEALREIVLGATRCPNDAS